MSTSRPNVMEELQQLDRAVGNALQLQDLRPIFYRLEEISKQAPDDLDIQLTVGDIKQHLVNKGNQLKEQVATTRSPTVAHRPPPSPPSAPQAPILVGDNTQLMPAAQPGVLSRPPGEHRPQTPPAPQAAVTPSPPFSALPRPAPSAEQPAKVVQNLTAPTKKGGLASGILIGLVGAATLGAVVWVLQQNRTAGIPYRLMTEPPGAAISVDGKPACTSNCDFALAAGDHEIGARLDGYEAATGKLVAPTKAPATPQEFKLALVPQPQSLRIVSDLGAGEVMVDNHPPVKVAQGPFVMERVGPGRHTVKVTGDNREVAFSIEIAPGRMPFVTGTVTTKNALAVLVSTMGDHARLVTSSGPWKLSVNGTAESEAGPAGVELKAFKNGENEIAIGEGAEERKIKETFGPAPSLTAFLKQAQDAGTLTIATGEDGVRVWINGIEQAQKTIGGQLRLRTLGPVTVGVAKDGFLPLPPKSVELKRDADVRMLFQMIAAARPAEPGGAAPSPAALTARAGRPAPAPELPPPALTATPSTAAPSFTLPSLPSAPPPASAAAPTPTPAPKPADSTKQPEAPAPSSSQPANAMLGFDNPDAWRLEKGLWRHRGTAFLSYKLPGDGIFTFEVHAIRGGQVRWAADYSDARNYTLFELDQEVLGVCEVRNGRRTRQSATRHGVGGKEKKWTLRIEVTPDHVKHSILRDNTWVLLNTWTQPGRNFADGKFGFLVTGSDEIALSRFDFTPRK